jgi:hypothetical protein
MTFFGPSSYVTTSIGPLAQSAGEAAGRRGPTRHCPQFHVWRKRNLADMHLEDAFAPDDIWIRYNNLAIEAARTQQRRIEHVGTVRRPALVGLKAVHLDEELVQGLLAFVIASAEARVATATYCIDFIDEDDALRPRSRAPAKSCRCLAARQAKHRAGFFRQALRNEWRPLSARRTWSDLKSSSYALRPPEVR